MNKNKKPKWRFLTARLAPKLRYYGLGDIIYSFYRISAVEHDGGV